VEGEKQASGVAPTGDVAGLPFGKASPIIVTLSDSGRGTVIGSHRGRHIDAVKFFLVVIVLVSPCLAGCASTTRRSPPDSVNGAPVEHDKSSASPVGLVFDTAGVDFGPWIHRFMAQIKKNWYIPYSAVSLKAHVVASFNVQKDGRITDLVLKTPCGIPVLDEATLHAVSLSSPTKPLPAEYPRGFAVFTVTFYYNESPPK
jgi:hypothetical protein